MYNAAVKATYEVFWSESFVCFKLHSFISALPSIKYSCPVLKYLVPYLISKQYFNAKFVLFGKIFQYLKEVFVTVLCVSSIIISIWRGRGFGGVTIVWHSVGQILQLPYVKSVISDFVTTHSSLQAKNITSGPSVAAPAYSRLFLLQLLLCLVLLLHITQIISVFNFYISLRTAVSVPC